MIFERFTKMGSATTLVRALRTEGIAGKRGKLVDKGYLYKLLNNRIYVGEAVHKGASYPGEHEAIVDRALWDKVHSILQESPETKLPDAVNFRDRPSPGSSDDSTRLYRLQFCSRQDARGLRGCGYSIALRNREV